MKQAAIRLIQEIRTDLTSIARDAESSGDTTSAFEKLKRWKLRAARQIAEGINVLEGKKLGDKRKMSFRMGDPLGNLMDEAQMYEGFLIGLADEIERYPDEVLKPATVQTEVASEAIAFEKPKGQSVFIVHGHDELNLFRLKELLRDRYGLESIVLSSEAGKGRTLIEKFEGEAQRAAYAFVLLTPDDVIAKEGVQYNQARPNVLFELGWFYGRLGRDRVCILFKKGTKIHSDLDGIGRIEFNQSITEKIDEIEKELLSGKLLKKAS